VMVTAPLLVLLYDRTFVTGSFLTAVRNRWRYYLALTATWLALAALMAGTAGRGGSVGFGLGMSVQRYAWTQAWAIAHYLRLVFWPEPLVIDYGTALVQSWTSVIPQLSLLAGLAGLTVWALWHRPAWGFLGAWFFAILAPTSTFVPIITEPVAEHRMYLPLAAVLMAVVWAGVACVRRWLLPYSGWILAPLAAAVGAAAVLGTEARNRDYQSLLALWTQTVRAAPQTARVHNNLGQLLSSLGRGPEAVQQFAAALALDPGNFPAHFNLGVLLLDSGHADQAEPHLRQAIAGPRHVAEAHRYLAEALERQGRPAEAGAEYQASLQLEPNNSEAAFGWGNALAAQGRYREAIVAFRRAVVLAPTNPGPRSNLGTALLYSGDAAGAIAEYREALRLQPGNTSVLANLAEAVRLSQSTAPRR